jgi:Pvc16 N-terminal domain
VKADAILRVTEALRDRLRRALASSGVPGTVFVGPLDDAGASGAALILFLYRVVPNADLRNREHRVPFSNGTPPVQVFRNALPLDLYFLVTVGTTPGSSEETLLRALGFAMQELQADPDLTGPAVSQEPVRVTLEPLTTEEASRIWALFPTANYRTSIAYLATPIWIDPPKPAPTAAPVVEHQLRAGANGAEALP